VLREIILRIRWPTKDETIVAEFGALVATDQDAARIILMLPCPACGNKAHLLKHGI